MNLPITPTKPVSPDWGLDPDEVELSGGDDRAKVSTPTGQIVVTDPDASARVLPDGSRLYTAPIQATTSYVQELRQLHGLYRRWADDPDQALHVLDVIEGDNTVSAALKYLALEAIGNRWSVATDDPQFQHVAGMAESAVRKLPKFLNVRLNLMRAVLRGLSLVAIRWEKRACRLAPDPEVREWWVPVGSMEVDKRRLRLFRVPGRRDLAYWGIYDPGIDQYVLIEDREINPWVPPGFAAQDFIWYRADDSERSVLFGEGLGDQLFEIVGIKQRVIQYRARLAERWAEPTFIAKIDTSMGVITEATMGDAFLSPYVRSERLSDKIEKWRARHTLTLPKHDELEIHEHGGPSAGQHEEFLRFLNSEIKTGILLTGLVTEGGAGNGGNKGGVSIGSGSDAAVRQDAFDANAAFHRTGVEEACSVGLVWEFVRRNASQLQAAGYPVPYQGDLRIEFTAKRQTSPEALEPSDRTAPPRPAAGATPGRARVRTGMRHRLHHPAPGRAAGQPVPATRSRRRRARARPVHPATTPRRPAASSLSR